MAVVLLAIFGGSFVADISRPATCSALWTNAWLAQA